MVVNVRVLIIPAFGTEAQTSWYLPETETVYRELRQCAVYHFKYPSAERSESPSLKHTAKLLSESLVKYRQEHEKQDCPWHIAAHSTGGLVLKEAVITLWKEQRREYDLLARRCLSLGFFGVPRRFSS